MHRGRVKPVFDFQPFFGEFNQPAHRKPLFWIFSHPSVGFHVRLQRFALKHFLYVKTPRRLFGFFAGSEPFGESDDRRFAVTTV